MTMSDETIVDLKQIVTAAQEEFDLAVSFHEIWKPAAYDQDLHNRLGTIRGSNRLNDFDPR